MPVCFFVVVPATDFFPRNPLCDVDCGSTLFPQTLSTTTSEAAHPCGDLSHKLWRERSTSACTVARASHRSTSSTDRPGVPVRVLQEGVSVARGAARPPPSSPRVRARELAWLAGARLRGRGWLRSVALGSPAALPDPQTDVFPPDDGLLVDALVHARPCISKTHTVNQFTDLLWTTLSPRSS